MRFNVIITLYIIGACNWYDECIHNQVLPNTIRNYKNMLCFCNVPSKGI